MRRYFFYALFLFVFISESGFTQNYTRGVELFHAKRYAAAAVELEKALEAGEKPERIPEMEYLLAVCAVEQNSPKAKTLLSEFLEKYPNSIYNNDVRMSVGELDYAQQKYDDAQGSFLVVNPFELTAQKRDVYNFKMGHTQFMLQNDDKAYGFFQQVGASSQFAPHSTYYMAYIDYVKGNYTSAKKGFASLASVDAYSKIVPYYLLQIEFLQGNYTYVTEHGDNLAASVASPRDREILRLLAESWYHLKDYPRALAYMEAYEAKGGEMGRNENYIKGYCNYERRDYAAAAESLALVCAVDDNLSQNASYHLADCYLKIGDKQSALKSFAIASVGDYNPAIREDALFNYGKLQYELGGGVFNEAINVLSRYIKEYPKSVRTDQAREYLLAAYYNSLNYEAAYEAIQQIPNPDNNIKTALQKVSYFRALEYFTQGDMDMADKLLALSMKNRFNAKYTALTSYWQGEIMVSRDKYKEAIPLFDSYIKVSPESEPEHTTAYYNLGYCNFNLKNWEAADKAFNRFVQLYPQKDRFKADAYNRLGDVAYVQRAFWKAIELYDKAVAQATTERYYAEFQRAVMLGMVDRPQRKIESLQAIVAGGKGDYVDDAMYELGRTYTSQELFTDAARSLKNFIDKYPNSPKSIDAAADLGLIYQNIGDHTQALKYYKIAATKAPHSSVGRDALEGVKGIYVDMNDVDGFFGFASGLGIETNKLNVERDSLSFAAAEKIYLSGSAERGLVSMKGYVKSYPRGTYRASALYYGADCAQRLGEGQSARTMLEELGEMYYNDFTVRGLEKLGAIQLASKEYSQAAATYKRLSETATDPAVINSALMAQLNAVAELGDTQNTIIAANSVLGSPFADGSVVRAARFAKATALQTEGDREQAIELYKVLSREPLTAEGAKSAYAVIEHDFAAGDDKSAEDQIMKLADSNTTHTYWVGKAFLVLGDIYVKRGDKFQARATYQSIMDGYSTAGDGIVDAAKEKIKNLK